MRTDPYKKARRDALREAQTFLFRRAKAMNDPWAAAVLNAAAFEFGVEKLRGLYACPDEDEAVLLCPPVKQ